MLRSTSGSPVSGTYTEVHQSTDSATLVAIKSYKPTFNNSKKVRSEIELLSGLPHHDNVVPLLRYEDDGASISLIMPWMSGGTLTSFIDTHEKVLETAAKSTLVHDISAGLHHRNKVHSNFIVHGNLESDNILINEQHRACISGFRQSVKLSSIMAECPRPRMPPRPAIQFAGPEWFVKDDTRFQPLPKTLFKSDIYSLGCVMFYVFTKCMPWYDGTSMDISDKLRQRVTPSRPEDSMVDDQWALIEPCLRLLPQKRPSASDLLKIIKEYLVSVGPCDLTGQIKQEIYYPADHGGYAFVYEGTWRRKTGGAVKVAVKVLRVGDFQPRTELDENLKRELAAWRRLSHRNIVSLLGTTMDIGGSKGMVSLWMENGSLEKYTTAKGALPSSQKLHLVNDIAEGLKYLHEHPIIHGDLTPSNVLINHEGRAMLTDFGLSVILGGFTNLSCVYTDAKAGAPAWVAPELVDLDGFLRPSKQSDIYSFAYIMYLIFSGCRPWLARGRDAGMTILMHVKNGKRPKNPGNIDARYWKLIEQCWSAAPDLRPAINDVLQQLY